MSQISVTRVIRGIMLGGLLGTALLAAATIGTMTNSSMLRLPQAQAVDISK